MGVPLIQLEYASSDCSTILPSESHSRYRTNQTARLTMRPTKQQDAFGWAVWDHYHGKTAYEIIERSDGYVAISGGPAVYLSEYSNWAAHEKAAIKRAHGKVLDIGCKRRAACTVSSEQRV